MLLRWATFGLVLGGLVGHASAAGQRLQIGAANETSVPAAGWNPAERISDVGTTDVPAGPIDLTKDADGNGLPDELEAGVDAARAIASGGDPNQLDDGELDPFAAVIMDLADRLPLSARTRKDQQHILELTAELNTAGPKKARRILRRIGRRERELRKDPNLELVMESLDRMLGPATADDGTAAGIPAAVVPIRRPAPTRKPAFEQLQRGDVMLLRSRGSFLFPWTVYYSHAGTYDGNNMVYESLGDGVQLGPLQHWKERGTRVGLGRSKKSSPAQVVAALQQAQSRYGTNKKTPYNFLFPNKTRDDAIYCSQLTWKIHKSLGVDLDSNDWRWFLQVGLKNIYATPVGIGTLIPTVLVPAVAPDEVYYSPNVSFYSQGDN
jgi:permuted papain-like amidase YaeF/Yiix C92 family enzyme